MRRRGMGRFARRKAERRLGVLGWDMAVGLLGLPMQRGPLQVRVILFLLEPVGRVGALLVASGNVARGCFALRARLGAFEDDEIAGHDWLFFALGGRLFFFVFGGFLGIGQAEERGDRGAAALHLAHFLDLGLALDGVASERDRLQPRMGDRLAAHLADAVRAGLNALERFLDLVERILLLREEREGKIAIVSVAAGIGLVH